MPDGAFASVDWRLLAGLDYENGKVTDTLKSLSSGAIEDHHLADVLDADLDKHHSEEAMIPAAILTGLALARWLKPSSKPAASPRSAAPGR